MALNNDLKNDKVFSLRAKTIEECIAILDKQYDKNYEIMRKKAVTLSSFFGLIKTTGFEVHYIELDKPKFDFLEALNKQNEYQQQMQNRISPQKPVVKPVVKTENDTISPQLKVIAEQVSFIEATLKQTNPSSFDVHPSIKKMQEFLEKNEFSPSYSNTIINKIRSSFSLDDLDNYEKVYESVIDWIANSFLVEKPFYNVKPQIIMLVGPTGVGKTTTIAKIAAHLTVMEPSQRKTAHIITIDRVRIAAIEQIEGYGKHMNMNVTVAVSNNDLRNQIDKYAAAVDYVFIDTVGASPNDTKLLLNMKDIVYFRENNNFKTYLTLSASTKNSDMKEIIHSYSMFNYDSLIITKLDETKSVGNIISVLSDTQKTLSYITTGQSVPHNIEIASVSKLLKLLEQEQKQKQLAF